MGLSYQRRSLSRIDKVPEHNDPAY